MCTYSETCPLVLYIIRFHCTYIYCLIFNMHLNDKECDNERILIMVNFTIYVHVNILLVPLV